MKPHSTQERLQAVILLDASYTYSFEPLTVNYPKCLIQLANAPLIEYSLEWLFVTGCVSEIFIMGHQRTISPLRVYIESQSKWAKFIAKSQGTKSMTQGSLVSPLSALSNMPCPILHFIICPNSCNGIGDYLRELDAENIIVGDFVLLRSGGDIVSNVNLSSIWQEHKTRRETNRNAIMTTICTQKSPLHRSRSLSDNIIYILEENTCRILDHLNIDIVDMLLPKHPAKKLLNLPINLTQCPSILCRFDLVDGYVDICSMEVLALFTENFDYQDMFQDFVKGILSSDILSHQFYLHILKNDEYLNRASDPYLYDSLTKDMLQRWIYPIVPDSNLFHGLRFADYTLTQGSIYISHSNVHISRSVTLSGDIMIGSDTTIDHNATIRDTIIGNGCIIGPNVTIIGSYIFDGVKLDSNVNIVHCIIGQACHVKSGTILSKGTILAPCSIIGPNVIIPPQSKLITIEDFCSISKRRIKRVSFEDSESDEITVEDDYNSFTKDDVFDEDDSPSLLSRGFKEQERLEIPLGHLHLSDEEKSNENFDTESMNNISTQYDSECKSFGAESNVISWTLSRAKKFHLMLEELSSEDELEFQSDSSMAREQLVCELQTMDNDRKDMVSRMFTEIDQKQVHMEYDNIEESRKGSKGSNDYRRTDSDSYESWHGSYGQDASRMGMDRSSYGGAIVHSKQRKESSRRPKHQEEVQHFVSEISDTLRHALQTDPISPVLVENTCLEINALKFACNMGFEDIRVAITPVLVNAVLQRSRDGKISYSAAVQEIFTLWSPMLQRFTATDGDQLHLLSVLVDTCISHIPSSESNPNLGTKIFPWIITELYQNDVLKEEVILRWWKRESEWQYTAPGVKAIRASVTSFIQWLEEAEEDQDSSSTSDNEEDE